MTRLLSRFLLMTIFFLRSQNLISAKDEKNTCLSTEEIAKLAYLTTSAISLNPDSNQLAISTNNGIDLYNADTLTIKGNLQSVNEYQFGGSLLSWSPDGNKIAAYIGSDSGIRIWDVNTKQIMNHLMAESDDPLKPPSSMAWSSSGKYLALAGTGTPLWIWDVDESKLIFEFETKPKTRLYTDLSNLFVWSPDKDNLAFVDGNNINIWVVKDDKVGKPIVLPSGFSEAVGVAWSKQQQLAVTEGGGYSIKIFDTQNWETESLVVSELTIPYNPVVLNWLNNDSILAVGTYTGQILLVDTKKDKIMKETNSYVAVTGFSNSLIQLASSEDGKTIFSLNRDFIVFKWNMELGCVTAIVQPPSK